MLWYWWVVIWMVVAAPILVGLTMLLKKAGADASLLPGMKLWPMNSAPFMLVVDAGVATATMQSAAIRALQFWEDNIPGLWVPFGEVTSGPVVPIIGSSQMENYPGGFGYTRISMDGDVIAMAAIYIDASRAGDVSDLGLWRAIAHEMGHVVGLAHDPEIRMSVMYPKTLHEKPTLTAQDKALLKAIYMR